MISSLAFSFFFFFNDTATTEIYTLSLHDALPISTSTPPTPIASSSPHSATLTARMPSAAFTGRRSEEHTSELQSLAYLVCRLLLEKKKKKKKTAYQQSRSSAISVTEQSRYTTESL